MWTIIIIALVAVAAYAAMVGWERFKGEAEDVGKFTLDKAEDVAEDVSEFAGELAEDIEDVLFRTGQGMLKLTPYLIKTGFLYTLVKLMLAIMYMADGWFSFIQSGMAENGVSISGMMLFALLFVVVIALDTLSFSTLHMSKEDDKASVLAIMIAGTLMNLFITQVITSQVQSMTSANNVIVADGYSSNKSDETRFKDNYTRLDALTQRSPTVISTLINSLLIQEPDPKGGCQGADYGAWSRANCPRISTLRVELANAQSRDINYSAWTKKRTARLSKGGSVNRTESDPFGAKVERLTGLKGKSAMDWFFVALGVFITVSFVLIIRITYHKATRLQDADIANFDRKKVKILEGKGLLKPSDSENKANYFTPTAAEKASGQLHVDLLAIFETRLKPSEGDVLPLDGENGFHAIYKKHVLDDRRNKYEPLGPNFIAALNVISKDRERIEATNNTILDWAEKGVL